MARWIEIKSTKNPLRQWILNLYAGIEDYFPLPERVTTQQLARVAYWKTIDSARRQHERIWEPRFEKLLRQASEEVASAYRGSGTLTAAQHAVDRFLVPRFRIMLQDLQREVEPEFIARAPKQVSRKGDWDETDIWELRELVDWNERVTASKVTQVSSTTKEAIAREVRASMDTGASLSDIASQLQSMHSFSRFRAYMIARTEVISASNAATHFGIRKFMPVDAGMTKDWLATGDKRTRPTHITAGGSQKDIPYDKPFQVGGSELMFPGDGSMGAAAKEVIQCRCTALYHLPKVQQLATPPPVPVTRIPRTVRTAKPKPAPKPKPSTPEAQRAAWDQRVADEVDGIVQQIEQRVTADALDGLALEYKELEELIVKLRGMGSGGNRIQIMDRISLLRSRISTKAAQLNRIVHEAIYLPTAEQAEWKITVSSTVPMVKTQTIQAKAFLDAITRKGTRGVELPKVVRSTKSRRSYASHQTIHMSSRANTSVYVHELGHTFEHADKRYLEAAVQERKRRTAGERAERLKALFPNSGYDLSETTLKDKFIEPYQGKIYASGAQDRATEMLSMSLELLHSKPAEFFYRDRDSFKFILRLVREGKRP